VAPVAARFWIGDMGETTDGPSEAARRAQPEGDPDSPGKANFLSRLFRWEQPEEDEEDDDRRRRALVDGVDMLVNLRKLREPTSSRCRRMRVLRRS
jgi:hypothetical protein